MLRTRIKVMLKQARKNNVAAKPYKMSYKESNLLWERWINLCEDLLEIDEYASTASLKFALAKNREELYNLGYTYKEQKTLRRFLRKCKEIIEL